MSAISKSVRLEQLQADAAACGPDALALFKRLMAEGKTPEAAAMYACQQAPGTRFTDRAFCQGQHRKMENMDPLVSKMLHGMAKESGIDSRGKYYLGGLAERGKGPRDPAAWVTCAEDVLTIAKAKNLQIDGVLNRQAVEKETPEPKTDGLAPDIVRRLAKQALEKDPSLRERVRTRKHGMRELQENLLARHRRKKFTRKTKLFR
jgi:hypothetical protein